MTIISVETNEIFRNFYKSDRRVSCIHIDYTQSTGQNTTVWNRHSIDNTLKGADGARFEDANGDGLADIVTGREQSGLVRVYFNPGKELVKYKWKYVTVGVAPNVEDAVLDDLDGDGSLDVVSSSEGKTTSKNFLIYE